MLGSQHPDKSAVGRKQTDSASASITEKSNLQLLNEVEAMLSVSAEEMDTDRIEEYLSLLQKRAPVAEHYDPEEKWAKLEESHPLIFEEETSSCKSDLAAEARNRHGNRTRRSFSRVFRAAAIAAAAAFCFIITASAMGFQPVQAVLRWAEGIIQIYTNPSGIMELPDDDPSEYHSLYDALAANGISTEGLPTWVPRDYAILSVTAKSSDGVIKCVAVYESNRGNIVIRALKIISPDITVAEERDTDAISYQHNQEEFFIVSDRQWMKADWENEGIFFSISGQISEDEIKEMIDSIQ